MRTASSLDRVRAWKPTLPGVREVFHARFIDHAYPRHTHDAWTVFIVDEGMIRYDLEHTEHAALPPMVTVLPPGVVHDGHPATRQGFTKRVMYVEADMIGEHRTGSAVDRPIINDITLRSRISALHPLLIAPDDLLEAETRLAYVVERITCFLGQPVTDTPSVASAPLADSFREFLDEHLCEPVTLAMAGSKLGASPTHLARSFTKEFGIAPHAYQLGRRVDTARQRLLDGQPPAEVAVAVGFYDQSHFTRHFKRHVGTTPSRFAKRGPALHMSSGI